jgi:uncharacterized protein involved in exopolysaccharide biosynthesis
MESANIQTGTRIPMRSPTMRDIVAVLFRHKSLIIASFLAVFLGVIIGTSLLPKQYEAHMKILVKRERADPVVTPAPNAQEFIARDVTQEGINSEVELIKSRDLLENVVIACGLHTVQTDSPLDKLMNLFEPPATVNSAGMRIPRAVQALDKRLEVEPIAKSQMIDVTYTAPDPQLAAKVLQTLSTLYLEKHLLVHRPPGALDFFQQQAGQYHDGLASAEQQLASFSRDQGVVSIDLEKDITLRKLSDFEAELRESRAAQAAAQQRVRSLEAQLAATPARVITSVRTSDNPYLIQMRGTLLSLELKRTELLTKFQPGYRLVQEVEQQIAQTRDALAQAEKNTLRDETTDLDKTHGLLEEELAKARAELATLQGRSAEIEKSVAAYQDRARQISRKEIAHQDLVRQAKMAEDNYLLYLRKQEEARISDALDRKRILNVAIAEEATVPAIPSSPKWGLNLLLGLILAFLTSLGLGFAADYMNATFRTPDEVEGFLGMPVLASVPRN